MDIISDLNKTMTGDQSPVLAIGNFDGVHLGHQAILAKVKAFARERGVPSAVLTFEPHPRKLFRPDDPPFRITPACVKETRLARSGIDTLYALPFDWDFASQSAEDFIANVLMKIRPSLIVIGKDFRFGQLRKGTPDMIKAAGIPVHLLSDIKTGADDKISSTAIREALYAGDIDTANALLGWEWIISGTVVRGDRRGHELGYPTANVLLGDTLHPAYGIYASYVRIDGEETWHKAATNIGIRPMFELKVGQVEAHILDFPDCDIYGKALQIRPFKRLRGEAKFSSLDDLVRQIEEDCQTTRKILP